MDNIHEMIEGDAYTLAIRHIKMEEHVPRHLESSSWTQRRGTCLKEGNQPVGQSKRYLNSASMSVLCRRIMAIEWMRALGRTIPEHYAIVPRRGTELLRTKRILNKNG